MDGREFININVGRLSQEQAANIAREIRYIWRYLENVYPQGDKRSRPQLKVTIDQFQQYHFYLNHQAFKLILLYVRDVKALVLTEQVPGLRPQEPLEEPF